MLAEAKAVKAKLERERLEQAQAVRRLHLQDIHDHQDTYWQQVDKDTARGTGTGYDEALRLLIELRDAAEQFKETPEFQNRFQAWVHLQSRRPSLIKRLQDHKFPLL